MHLSDFLKRATGITCHSKEVRPGYIFVAIRGRVHDGNAFAAHAIAKGAIAIVTDSALTTYHLNVPVITVPDARAACAWLASEYYGHPSKELSLVGVTGTNGKTTIVAMLEHIYRTAGLRAGMIGTVSVKLGDYSFPSKLTTPDAISLQRYLRQMSEQSVTHAAMEVSAQGMELNRVDHVTFACGILANVCPDHLDFHGDFAHYLAAKQLFPSFLFGSPLIVNAADHCCLAIARTYDGPVITAAVNRSADVTAQVFRSNQQGSVFALCLRGQFGEFVDNHKLLRNLRLPVPGLHNVENAMFAAIAALNQGLSPYDIAAALASFGGVERRFKIFEHSGCTIIDDTALNPGSIDAVFHTVEQFSYNRLVVVNAIRGCRGPAINVANAQTLVRWQKYYSFMLIITASCDQTTYADLVSQQEKEAFLSELDHSQIEYVYTETLAEAILVARTATQPGDVLVLIGAQGMDHGYSLLAANPAPFTTLPSALQH